MAELETSHPWLSVHSLELTGHPENVDAYIRMAARIGQEARAVPAFLFCGQMHVGFDSATAPLLRRGLQECHENARRGVTAPAPRAERGEDGVLVLPLLGEIDPARASLPLLTVALAALDAFNPCVFFVLLFLLSLLIRERSRARMVVIGGIFVLASGVAYFVFMAAWLNVFLLMGQIRAVTLAAGGVAVVIALINIKDYFWFRRGVSLSIPERAKPGLYQRMHRLQQASRWPAMVLGTATLAVTANTYELLCTAGFPMAFTRALTLHRLPETGYYLYLVLYNVVYIVPLALIVGIFAFTLSTRKLTEREGRLLKLLSGAMMLGLGVLLLTAPERLSSPLTAAWLVGAALGVTALVEAGANLLAGRRGTPPGR